VRTREGTLPTGYTFTGQRVDASAGLMYYNARYYDAALGRFISADTIIPNLYDPQALNRYTYVRNNPLRYKDPSGHFPVDWLIDIGSILFDIHQLVTEPSWENAGWLALDVGLGITPYVPAGAGPAAKAAKAAGTTAKTVKAADKLSDAAHALAATERLIKGGVAASERAELVKAIAKASVKNGDATHVILGSFPEYTKAGGTFFDLSEEVWKLLEKDPELLWEVNKQFIDDMISQGKEFHIVTSGKDIGKGLARELEYLNDLVEKGIVFYDDVRDVYVPIFSPW
jgi:RHS repeat-associated protein